MSSHVVPRRASKDDAGVGKTVGINRFIGKRPIAAFGNSDAERGFVNGLPDTHFGTFSQALVDEAKTATGR